MTNQERAAQIVLGKHTFPCGLKTSYEQYLIDLIIFHLDEAQKEAWAAAREKAAGIAKTYYWEVRGSDRNSEDELADLIRTMEEDR